jgi:hypothetical protein
MVYMCTFQSRGTHKLGRRRQLSRIFPIEYSGLQGKLYYFKSADDPPNYKGLIDMRECKAEDVDVDGLPRNAAKSKYDLDGGGGQVSLLIRISHKVRTRL